MTKWVYAFGAELAEGRGAMKNLLGGKGANLAEMAFLGLPVPPGFTITTEVCTYFYANGKTYPGDLAAQVDAAMAAVERQTGRKFGDDSNPLLVSVRSGARASMPGMMDTVLNLGLNDKSVLTLAKTSGDERFAYDSYRRFIQMYSNVVLEVEHNLFEEILEELKDHKGHALDTDLSAADWREIIAAFKKSVAEATGKPFPQAPRDQLWGAIGAVFCSVDERNARSPIAASTTFPPNGAPRSTSRRWCSATWARPRRPASPSPATPPPAPRSSTANSSSTRRARTSSPASAPRRTSPRPRARPPAPTSLRWKR